MTLVEPPALTGINEARELTDQIKVAVEATWQLVARAYTTRAWALLGYASWDDYCTREFGTSRLRLPREERSEVVASLRDSGLSLRAIAAVTGDSPRTVRREISGGANATPAPASPLANVVDAIESTSTPNEEDAVRTETATADEPTITGIDGKTYKAKSPHLAMPQPPKYGTRRRHHQQIEALLASLSGALIAFDGVDELDDTVTAEEAGVLSADLSKQIQALSRINKLLKERTTS